EFSTIQRDGSHVHDNLVRPDPWLGDLAQRDPTVDRPVDYQCTHDSASTNRRRQGKPARRPAYSGWNEPNGAQPLSVAYELPRSMLHDARDLAGLRHLNCFDTSHHALWRTSDRPHAADRHRPEHAVSGLHPAERG